MELRKSSDKHVTGVNARNDDWLILRRNEPPVVPRGGVAGVVCVVVLLLLSIHSDTLLVAGDFNETVEECGGET